SMETSTSASFGFGLGLVSEPINAIRETPRTRDAAAVNFVTASIRTSLVVWLVLTAVPHNYQVQRPHTDRSARGRAATSRAGGSAARGRALYGDAARCNAELGGACVARILGPAS